MSRVDQAAVRNTRDVDLLLRREDLEAAKQALSAAGFVCRHPKSIDMFLDGPNAKARDAVHILYAGEKVREDDLLAAPDVTDAVEDRAFRVITLEALVRMKLTSYRRKDQVHLLDLIELQLVDQSWTDNLPATLGERLQRLLDDPEG